MEVPSRPERETMCACKVGYGGLQELCTSSSSSSSFSTRVSRIVGGLKQKRKSLAAQHTLLLDVLSSPPTPASCMPLFLLLTSHDICTSHTLSASPPPPSPALLTPPPPSSDRSSSTSYAADAISDPSSSTSCTADATSVQNVDAASSYPPSLHRPNIAVQEAKENKTPCPDLAAPRSLCAALLITLLTTLLYTGKEVAMVSYLVLWIAWKMTVSARRAFSCIMTCLINPDGGCKSLKNGGRGKCKNTKEVHHRRLIRSSTMPRGPHGVGLPMVLQWKRRSKYSTCSSLQGKTISSERGRASARVKLHMMIVVVLCGLAHGRILALGMALFSIFLVGSIEALVHLFSRSTSQAINDYSHFRRF